MAMTNAGVTPDEALELICILFPVTETVIFVPAVIPTAPVNPAIELTMFGADMFPLNEAPLALIPALNV